MQVLALLLVLRSARSRTRRRRRTSLLVAPASLLANWAAEIERFAPTLRTLVAHPSAMAAADLTGARSGTDRRTSISSSRATDRCCGCPGCSRCRGVSPCWTKRRRSRIPRARQTRAAKQLDAHARIALTGTPVENRLGDLWSIFDFINPGLLGSGKAFSSFTKRLADRSRTMPTRRCASWCVPTSCGA